MIELGVKEPSDSELKELLILQTKVKDMSERIEELKDLCKARGSFCTKNFVCAVIPQERTGLAPLKEVEMAIGKEVLEKYFLIKTSKYLIVKVSPLV